MAAAVGEDAVEEDGGGFSVGVLRPPVLGELALDRCLVENSSAVDVVAGPVLYVSEVEPELSG